MEDLTSLLQDSAWIVCHLLQDTNKQENLVDVFLHISCKKYHNVETCMKYKGPLCLQMLQEIKILGDNLKFCIEFNFIGQMVCWILIRDQPIMPA